MNSRILPSSFLLCSFFASLASAAPLLTNFTATEPDEGHITVTVQVSSLGTGNHTLSLYLGEATPRDGDPTQLLAPVASQTITTPGSYTFSPEITYGTHLACKAVLTDADSLSTESEVISLDATDSFGYSYIGTGIGNWHDPANWQVAGNDHGYKCVGYPAYTKG